MLFPANADNGHRVPQIVLITYLIVTIITIGRSLAHIFLPDGGANSIATIVEFSGTPNPNKVIYQVFAFWGLAQLAMGFIYTIVWFRYKNLIPLMWVFILFEYSSRIMIGKFLKPLGEDFLRGTAPGEIGNYVLIPIALIMLLLSFVNYKRTS